jgi:hypothetical protein
VKRDRKERESRVKEERKKSGRREKRDRKEREERVKEERKTRGRRVKRV